MSPARLVERYLRERKGALTPVSAWSERKNLDVLLRCLEGADEITRARVLAFIADVDARRTSKGEPWAPRTRHGVLAAARRLLRWAHLAGHLLEDLGVWFKLPRTTVLPRFLSEADAARLIEQGPRQVRDRAILEVLYGTGIRKSELLRLDLTDVALSEQTLLVRQGKGRKDRLVPFSDVVSEAVRAYLRQRPRVPGRLFLTRQGRPLTDGALKALIQRARLRAGLRCFASPHRLRHSYATHLLRRGASLAHIKALLGHASIVSTQVYTAVDVSDLKAMIERSHPRGRGANMPREVKP